MPALESRILAVLNEHPDGIAFRDLVTAVDSSRPVVRNALNKLSDEVRTEGVDPEYYAEVVFPAVTEDPVVEPPARRAALIMFVHGLGAGETAWWGSTKRAVMTSPELDGDLIEFWRYPTTHLGVGPVRNLMNRFGGGPKQQTIAQLGEHLWTDIDFLLKDRDELILVGHSMGGLVAAAALVKGSADEAAMAKLKKLIVIASPLGGAQVANAADKAATLWGGNVQTEDLRPDSLARQELMVSFVNRIVKNRGIRPLVIRASDDSVVRDEEDRRELTEPLPPGSWDKDVFTGEHSDSVQNLGPNDRNLKKLIAHLQP